MQIEYYERQKFPSENFPIRFHTDRLYYGDRKEHNYQNIKNNRANEIQPHWHEGFELWRIKTGKPTLIIDDKRFKVKEGDVIAINTNQLHGIRVLSGECVYEVLGVEYNFCKTWGFVLDNLYFKNLINDQLISSLFDKISSEQYSQKDFYETIIISSCLEILGILSRNYKIDRPIANATFEKLQVVRQMMQYISSMFASQQILKELSDKLTYSQYYLSHIFSKVTGMSVKDYQMQIRFQQAKKMLAQNKLTIFEIATICGYASESSFILAFRNRIGKTPLEYRKQKRK